MKNCTLNWLKGRLSYFKLVAIYSAILISLTFFVSAYGSADVSYVNDDYPQLNRYEDVEEHKTAEGVRAAAKANKARKAGDAARAAQKASKAAKRASEARNARRSAENAVDNAKKMSGSRAGSSKGGKTGAVGGDASKIFENSATERLPQFKGKPHKFIERALEDSGFKTTDSVTFKHPDGSRVRIDKYGNIGETQYKTANNAHVHKYDPFDNPLDDFGKISDDPAKTHIGLPNPPDLPKVRKRPHGAGVA